MAKKPRKKISPEDRAQRDALTGIRDELNDLHEISLMVTFEKGILPPLYGGEYLGDDREVIPLWGDTDDGPELGALLLRVMPDVEPEPSLESIREDFGLTNDWPIAELLDILKGPDGNPAVEGADEIKDLSILFALLSSQISPGPGYDRQTMVDYIVDMQPYAVFPIIPVTGEGEDLDYQWENIDEFRAEVVYADSPQLLEAAVWEYRLNHALVEEIKAIQAEGAAPDEQLMARDTASLSGMYDMLVMRRLRLYGTTSPIRARQQELDVLREENGDLIVRAPLKAEVEPNPILAEDRAVIEGNDKGMILHLIGESPMMQKIWPQVRASRFFCLGIRHGVYVPGRDGAINVQGYAETPTLEWLVSESLPNLYLQVRLHAIYEMLVACKLIDGEIVDTESPA